LVALVASAVLLTGCTGLPFAPSTPAPTTGEQTMAQACIVLYSREFVAVAKKAAKDAGKAKDAKALLKAWEPFRKILEERIPKVTNPTLKAQAQKTLKAMKKVISLLKSAKQTKAWLNSFEKAAAPLKTAANKLDALCFKS